MKIIVLGIILMMAVSCERARQVEETASDTLSEISEEPVSFMDASELAIDPKSVPNGVDNNGFKTREAIPRKIIHNANLEIEVPGLKIAKKRIDSLVKAKLGYVELESFFDNSEEYRLQMTIRVPASQFSTFLEQAESGKGQLKRKSIFSEDVSEEYIDVESRLETKKAYLKKYKELLSKARNVKEILEIEGQIRQIQEEIDSRMARLKVLDNQVEMSIIQLELVELKPIRFLAKHEAGFTELLRKSLLDGWNSFKTCCLWLITLWPWVLVIFSLYLGFKKWRRN